MGYTGETWQVVVAAIFVLLVFVAVASIIIEDVRRSARVRRVTGGVIAAGAMVRKSWAGYVLLFLAVLAALSVMGWMVPEDERDLILADMEASSERFMDWSEALNCSCLASYDNFDEVSAEPEEKRVELKECCAKEFCGSHMERDQDHQWCYCAGQYYGW